MGKLIKAICPDNKDAGADDCYNHFGEERRES
jgi:hypothetical protein